MKKICLLVFTSMILFLGSAHVKADVYLYSSYDSVQLIQNEMLGNEFATHGDNHDFSGKYQEILTYYEENYAVDYPYYYVVTTWDYNNSNTEQRHYTFYIDIYMSKYSSFASLDDTTMILKTFRNYTEPEDENGKYRLLTVKGHQSSSSDFYWSNISLDGNFYNDFIYYYHNKTRVDSVSFSYYEIIKALYDSNDPVFYTNNLEPYVSDFTEIQFPSIDEWNISEFIVKESEMLPTVYGLYAGEYSFPIDALTEINLNNYSYLLLVPKYDTVSIPFRSTFYYTGQSCVTPVYNFGRTQKDQVTNICESYSDTARMSNIYMSEDDYNKKIVYYIRPYDQTEDNLFYYNSNYFDVIYMVDDYSYPIVSYGGTDYEALRFVDLKSTANRNEELGYVPGESENFIDSLRNTFANLLNTYFVPKPGYFSKKFNELHEFFTNKFGILFYPFELVIDFFNRVSNISSSNAVISIPDIEDPIYGHVIIKSMEFDLGSISQYGQISTIHSLYLTIIDVILYLALVNLAYRKFVEIIKGYGTGEVEEDIFEVDQTNYISFNNFLFNYERSRRLR